MRLRQVLDIIEGEVLTRDVDLDLEVKLSYGTDLTSDVLAFSCAGSLLVTGLTNPQVVRTAEMSEISAIMFVWGRCPLPEAISTPIMWLLGGY